MKRLMISLITFVLMLGTSTLAQHDMHDMGSMNDMNNMGMEMGSHNMLSGLTGEELETQFLSGMIGHHEGAIDMAQWILERTQNAEIKEAAEAIIAAQEPEIQQMTQWLEEWYGQGVDEQSATMMQNEMDMMMQAMEESENPDAAFLEQMSLHHNSAIDMAQSALLGSNRPELRELATNIIVAQAQEIAQYQTWLDSLGSTSQLGPTQDMHTGHGSMQHGTMQHGDMQHGSSGASPYLDQLNSSVRGLSQEEIDGLLAGEGMGYARSAELNGYPGPRHVLDMADELQLTAQQRQDITAIFDDMKEQAVALGQDIVDAESLLSQSFADKTITEESLQEQLAELTNLYSQLRQVHLQAHLAVTPLLSAEQLEQYQTLRGYAQN
jgi:uncharacterized protein (DUF305 family)